MTAPVGYGTIDFSEVTNRTFRNKLRNNDNTFFNTLTIYRPNSWGHWVPEYIHFVRILSKQNGVIYIKPLDRENLLSDKEIFKTNCLAFIHSKRDTRILYCQDTLINNLEGTSLIAVDNSKERNPRFFSVIGTGVNDGIKLSSKTSEFVIKLLIRTGLNAQAHAALERAQKS